MEPELVKRLLAWRLPNLLVEDTNKAGGGPNGPTRMDTAGTIPTIVRDASFEANALPASNSKFLQVIGRRNGATHLDASNGV